MSTNIAWTDETWNAVTGCSRISAGCKNCYAAIAAASPRLQQFPQYQKVKDWDGTVEFVESQLLKPLSWKKPKRIFVCSMSDLFHENIPDEWRDLIFAVMALTPRHTYQLLTKRPENALRYIGNSKIGSGGRSYSLIWDAIKKIGESSGILYSIDFMKWPLPNAWLGTTVENQAMADKRIPVLLQIPAAVRFLSCEPLLEKIDLADIFGKFALKVGSRWESSPDWVIVGGESGKGSRPCHIDWVRSLVNQCKSADVPVFVKQLGSNPIANESIDGISSSCYQVKLRDRKGGDISEFPEVIQIREFPDAAIK